MGLNFMLTKKTPRREPRSLSENQCYAFPSRIGFTVVSMISCKVLQDLSNFS